MSIQTCHDDKYIKISLMFCAAIFDNVIVHAAVECNDEVCNLSYMISLLFTYSIPFI